MRAGVTMVSTEQVFRLVERVKSLCCFFYPLRNQSYYVQMERSLFGLLLSDEREDKIQLESNGLENGFRKGRLIS